MAHVDAISRLPTFVAETRLADSAFSAELKQDQQHKQWTEEQNKDGWCTAQRQARNTTAIEGLLYRISPNGGLQVLVPATRRTQVMRDHHDHILAAHAGRDKTYDKIRRNYVWPSMLEDIGNYVRTCETCQRTKSAPKSRPTLPTDDSISERATQCMEIVNLDIKGPLPKTSRNNAYILVLVDLASRWAEAFPIPDQRATTVAETITREFIPRHGCPKEWLSDRGSNFVSDVIKEMNILMQIKRSLSTPYSPWVNGCVERFNGTLAQLLSSYTDSLEDWDIMLPFALFAYRTATHSATGFSPSFLCTADKQSSPLIQACNSGNHFRAKAATSPKQQHSTSN